MTQIVIIDKHQIFREGLKALLTRNGTIEVVGEGNKVSDLFPLNKKYRPDILLVDIDQHFSEFTSIVKTFSSIYPDTKVIALTYSENDAYVLDCINAGVSGYLLKNMEPDKIIYAIQKVIEGYAYFGPTATKKLIKEYRKMNDNVITNKFIQTNLHPPRKILSKRECQILQLLTDGKSNRDISTDLFISEKTVKNHVSNVLLKLAVNDRTQAVLKGIKNSWVELR
ncbi:response regulator transcription factor [Psychrobacillus sp. FSL H8-0484]|uniref:response regulator transcription factor n=1 Tax=Psychrobacillus sp. FSL H8-0484 TaxID=2921390 RepID=UPI0030F787FC